METKYAGDPAKHPLREPIYRFTHMETPGMAEHTGEERALIHS